MQRVVRPGSAALLLVFGYPAGAQDQTGAGTADLQLEAIVVTAERRETDLQQTPIAISAFSTSALEAIGATDFTAVSAIAPNVNLMPASGQNGTVLSIRGIGIGDPSAAVDPKVGLYIDGVYVARSTATIFELDLERVEVLRGPQGTLWGKNTTGGSVNVITARPRGEFGFVQDLGFGEFGHLRARSVLDLPGASLGSAGTLKARLTYLKTRSDGWADRTNLAIPGPTQLGKFDSDSYRLALDWQFTDNVRVEYAYDRVERSGTARQDQLIGAVPALGVDAWISRRDRVTRFELDGVSDDGIGLDAHTLLLQWQLGNSTLKSITGYRDSDLWYGPDFDGTPAQYTSILLSNYQPYTGGLYNLVGERDHRQLSQELQWIGSAAGGRMDYVLGLYYLDEEGREATTGRLYYKAYGIFTDTSKTFTIDNQSKAIYGQMGWALPVLDDRLRVIVGARYTEDDKKVNKTNHNGRPADLRGSESWGDLSPTATLEYSASDALSLYLRAARGYNAGVFNVRSSAANFLNPADKETVTSYEFGMKSEWLDRRLRFNAAAFLARYEDMQQFVYVAGDSTAVNVGNTDLWGLEVEALARPIESLTLALTWGYLDYDIKRFEYGGNDVADSAVVAFAPKQTASAYIEYAWPRQSYGQFALRIDGVYKGKVSFDPLSYSRTQSDSYQLLNMRLALSSVPVGRGEFSVALWGRNLTDEDHQVFGIDFGEFQTGAFGDPRAFGVDLRVRFE